MAKVVPKVNDEVLGIEDAERDTYWCNIAMVRADYQGKGIAKALFQFAFKEVGIRSSALSRVVSARSIPFIFSLTKNLLMLRRRRLERPSPLRLQTSIMYVSVDLPHCKTHDDSTHRIPQQVPIYQKIGFKLYGERVIPSPWGDWPVWFFAKETRA